MIVLKRNVLNIPILYLWYLFIGTFMQKIALITGATGGLGQAIAKKLLEDNWNLILVS